MLQIKNLSIVVRIPVTPVDSSELIIAWKWPINFVNKVIQRT